MRESSSIRQLTAAFVKTAPGVVLGAILGTVTSAIPSAGPLPTALCLLVIVLWLIGYARFSRFEENERLVPVEKQAKEYADAVQALERELARSRTRSMSYRHVLIALRKILGDRVGMLDELATAPDGGPKAPTEALDALFAHKELMSEVMAAMFFVVSQGNQDLDRHVRVTFMEPTGEVLTITYFANSDNRVPTTAQRGIGFARGEGCAGRAWETGEPVTVADVAADLQASSPVFVPKTTPHHRYAIRSIMSIPISHGSIRGGERFIGVVNLDSDAVGHFAPGASQEEMLKLMRPFLWIIELVYLVHDLRGGR